MLKDTKAKQLKTIKILEEFKHLQETQIDTRLVEIIVGDRPADENDRIKIAELKEKLKNKYHVFILYTIIHEVIEDDKKAQVILENIISHKWNLSVALNRNTGIHVAALDFLKNISCEFTSPTLISEEKIATLAKSAIEDKMTQTFDKILLFNDLDKEIDRARRYNTFFSVLMLDIDNFKSVNDKYGHLFGDKVIIEVGGLLKRLTRTSDSVYRYGGDEFIVVLLNTSDSAGLFFANKIMESFQEISMTDNDLNINIKINTCISFSSFNKDNVKDSHSLIATLDKGLHKAKQSGKKIIYECTSETSDLSILSHAVKSIKPVSKTMPDSRLVLKGLAVSPGIAYGEAFIYTDILTRELTINEIKNEDLDKELKRFRVALNFVIDEIDNIGKSVRETIGEYNADIFNFQSIILKDPKLLAEIEEGIVQGKCNAEPIVKSVLKRWENRLKTSDSEIVQARSEDIADISRRILRTLTGLYEDVLVNLPMNSILIAKRLLPSDTVNLKHGYVRAVLTTEGSRSSHAALLTRSLNIPYMAQIKDKIEDIKPKTMVIVDTYKNEVIVNPDEKEIIQYKDSFAKNQIWFTKNIEFTKALTLKKDNKEIKIMANVSSKQEVLKSLEYGCSGIGLFRIEQLYMQFNKLPSSNLLFDILDDSLSDCAKIPVALRLLDIGGDKFLPYISLSKDINSALGLRGVRFLLKSENLLKDQILAFLKLSRKLDLSVMIPMVTSVSDILKVKDIINECTHLHEKENGKLENKIKLGAMIEVPAAVMQIDKILETVDYISIGTNDLIQYIMASDRENYTVSEYYDQGSEIILNFLIPVIKAVQEKQKECTICGELAVDLEYTQKILDLGITNFSVSVASIPKLKNKIANILGLTSG